MIVHRIELGFVRDFFNCFGYLYDDNDNGIVLDKVSKNLVRIVFRCHMDNFSFSVFKIYKKYNTDSLLIRICTPLRERTISTYEIECDYIEAFDDFENNEVLIYLFHKLNNEGDNNEN